MNPAFAMKLDCCMLISSLCFISATKRPFRRLCKLAQSNMDDILPSPALAAVPKNYIEFPFPYHQMIDLTIDDLSNLGSGVGRYTLPDGQRWVVMVPLALPGEIVKVKIFRNFKSYSEGDLIEILNPSKDRVKPECEYFEICGGCQYQHLSVSAQRDWKKKQVEELLVRIAGIEGVNVNDVVGTNEHYRYRSKITPHYDVPRKEGDLKIGFQKRGTRVMIDIPKCIITTDAINEKYLEVRTSIAESMKIKLPKKGATLLFRGEEPLHF
jgi:tRNA/tmRNA/rRNA uracil-C5-methylase (TrmA/RlmC/RlmD family)